MMKKRNEFDKLLWMLPKDPFLIVAGIGTHDINLTEPFRIDDVWFDPKKKFKVSQKKNPWNKNLEVLEFEVGGKAHTLIDTELVDAVLEIRDAFFKIYENEDKKNLDFHLEREEHEFIMPKKKGNPVFVDCGWGLGFLIAPKVLPDEPDIKKKRTVKKK